MGALEKAIELCGLTGLANALGISPQAVHKWRSSGVPADRVVDIERATGGRVLRQELMPALYEGMREPPATSPAGEGSVVK